MSGYDVIRAQRTELLRQFINFLPPKQRRLQIKGTVPPVKEVKYHQFSQTNLLLYSGLSFTSQTNIDPTM